MEMARRNFMNSVALFAVSLSVENMLPGDSFGFAGAIGSAAEGEFGKKLVDELWQFAISSVPGKIMEMFKAHMDDSHLESSPPPGSFHESHNNALEIVNNKGNVFVGPASVGGANLVVSKQPGMVSSRAVNADHPEAYLNIREMRGLRDRRNKWIFPQGVPVLVLSQGLRRPPMSYEKSNFFSIWRGAFPNCDLDYVRDFVVFNSCRCEYQRLTGFGWRPGDALDAGVFSLLPLA
jgi:hypothetical protein